MEEEAYKIGNLCFRDWEDDVKAGKIRISIPLKESLMKEEAEMEPVEAQESGLAILSRGMGMGGARDEKVARMQALLAQVVGSSALPRHGIDGRYGPETEQAVRGFQAKQGLQETGAVDALTLQKLEELGDTTKADQFASEVVAVAVASGGSGNKRFGADPSYEGGLTEIYERVSPQQLYSDLMRAGLNSNLSKALVSNAKGESGFVVGMAGDQGTYARVRFAHRSIPFNRKGPSCSLGLWQFNVCGGLGLEFMRSKGLTHEDDNEVIYKTITNYNNQIDFMSSYLLRKTRLPENATAEQYIEWLVRKVIRPADMVKAIRLRKSHLQGLEATGVFRSTLSEWKNEELNKLLLEKFNLGVIK
jgi:peptidoglycan hydrolase-like protein with peptidoglycan-binding domain